MSEAIKNLGENKKVSKKEEEKRYQQFIDDDLTFSIDEMLGVLGPRREII